MMTWYKGTDGNSKLPLEDSAELEEYQDVKDHQAFSQQVWDNPDDKDHLVQCNNIRKVFKGKSWDFSTCKKGKKAIAAVKKNSFCVKKGEILGLLGPNGAGKSTTFNLLTLDLKRSDGNIKILNETVDKLNIVKNGIYMGISPQMNTIWDKLTVD